MAKLFSVKLTNLENELQELKENTDSKTISTKFESIENLKLYKKFINNILLSL